MTQIYAQGYISGAISTAERKQADEDLRNVLVEGPGQTAETILTIAAGSITPTGAQHAVDTEASASADDLTNIAQTNHPDGRWLLIRPANAGRVVTVKHSAGGTGQISLATSADMVLNSTSHMLLLRRLGTLWQEVMRSARQPGLRSVQTFSAPGSWTRPAGVRSVIVECVGGGGGGGGTNGTSATQFAAGGGGGAGGWCTKLIDVTAIASATIVVGAAGSPGGTGGAGGTSSWNDGTNVLSATGGSGGQAGAVATVVSISGGGGGGGTATGGSYNAGGDPGGHGVAYAGGSGAGGHGGGSRYGGGGYGSVNANGVGAGGIGSGGGGGGSAPSVPGGRVGGAGAQGFVIVWEFAG